MCMYGVYAYHGRNVELYPSWRRKLDRPISPHD